MIATVATNKSLRVIMDSPLECGDLSPLWQSLNEHWRKR
jgi:hypothetical protein